ncbi:hypothetical protein ASL11_24715 [Paenibacillus sp. Soil750]|nr:hypothetical protein ASL11_24715 [Paenibacillus sp. Soil750]
MLWTLIMSQIVYVIFVLIWMFIAGMSVMMFDDPDAINNTTTWLIFITIWLYPVGLLAAIIGGWVTFSRRHYRASLIWNCIPLLWIVPLGGFLVYSIIM